MQKLSWRKLSVLGVVLLAASAVTAAIVPHKSESKFIGGSMTASDSENGGGEQSCTVSDGSKANCNVTIGTLTTAEGDNESVELGGQQTQGNTQD